MGENPGEFMKTLVLLLPYGTDRIGVLGGDLCENGWAGGIFACRLFLFDDKTGDGDWFNNTLNSTLSNGGIDISVWDNTDSNSYCLNDIFDIYDCTNKYN